MVRKKIAVLFISIAVFAAGFFTYQYFFPDNIFVRILNGMGDVSIESTPTATVFVDNKVMGQTPVQFALREGVYKIKLVPDATVKKTYTTWSDSIRIYRNTTAYIHRVLGSDAASSAGEVLTLEKSTSKMGQLLISTNPAGMFVSLDGEDRGLSTLFVDGVTAGEHEVGVRGEGLLPRSIPINVVEGYKLLISIKAAVDSDYKKKQAEKVKSKIVEQNLLEILSTPTGWLRVRFEPSIEASEAARVDTGKKFTYLDEQEGWYQIEYEKGKKGWVSAEYASPVKK
ncbi:MAG: PEGA domain-containing protein [Candidatus Roizmanbacteria bacterium]|nr:PEGA domain-containing protein [Candidatus Roizmanbacteria bacterium]